MIPRNLIVAAVVAGVAGGTWTVWKKLRTPLEKKPTTVRHLPGFSIAIPDGSTEKDSNNEYSAGKLELAQLADTRASLHLGWQYGEVPDGAAVLKIGQVAAKGLGASADAVHPVPGSDGRMLSLDSDGTGYMSITPCGTRVIIAVTMFAGRIAHKHIVDSIVCTPDESKENAPPEIPLAIDLPDYQIVEQLPGQITLESTTARVVMRRQAGNGMVDKISKNLGNDFLKAIGIDGALGPRHGDILTFTAKFDDVAQPGLFRFVTCDNATVLILAIAVDMPASNDVEQRMAAARCLTPGEVAPTWPGATPPADPETDAAQP